MKQLQYYIISTRFLLTIGHLIAILLTFWSYKSNVYYGFNDFSSQEEINQAERNVLVRER